MGDNKNVDKGKEKRKSKEKRIWINKGSILEHRGDYGGERGYMELPKEKQTIKWKQDWSEKGIEKYRERIKEIREVEEWEDLKEAIQKATTKKKVVMHSENKRNQWWDGECLRCKKELKEELAKCVRGEGTVEDYRKKKKEYRGRIQRKKEVWVEKWTEQLKKDKTEKMLWKEINRSRKKRNEVDEGIRDEEWRDHFKAQLEGKEIDETNGEEEEKEKWEEGKIEETEVRNVIRKLKRNKAPGQDKIANEAWIEGKEEIVKELTKTLNSVWREGKLPEEWKEGVIKPIFKKGDKKEASNYRAT